MTAQQLETRRKRVHEVPMVIQRNAEGYLVYSAADPDDSYLVTTDGQTWTCECPDFRNHNADPEWRCKHILAVMDKQTLRTSVAGSSQASDYEAEERAAIEREPEPQPQRRRRQPARKAESANGAAHMLIKRSISPDGRIDAVSVEFSTTVNGAAASEIKSQATKILRLQNEIAAAFLKLNGNGRSKPAESDPSDNPPQPAAPNGEGVPARLIDVGCSNGRYGERLFITVQANGKRLRLYGSPKQLSAYLHYAGERVDADQLEAGLRLNVPCRVVLSENGNGFVNVIKVLRAALPAATKGRAAWQCQ